MLKLLKSFIVRKYYGDWLLYTLTGPAAGKEKKIIASRLLEAAIVFKEVDPDIVPYLRKINSYSTMQTIFSCSGHDDGKWEHNGGYLWIETSCDEILTMEHVVRPLCKQLSISRTDVYDYWDECTYAVEIEKAHVGFNFTIRWRTRSDMEYILDLLLEHLDRMHSPELLSSIA